MTRKEVLWHITKSKRMQKFALGSAGFDACVMVMFGTSYITGGPFVGILGTVLFLGFFGFNVHQTLSGWPNSIQSFQVLLVIHDKMAEMQQAKPPEFARLSAEVDVLLAQAQRLVDK